MLEIFPVACILLSVRLYGSSNSNVPLHLSHHQDCFMVSYLIFIGVNLFIHRGEPVYSQGVRILKNYRSGDQDFLEKWGGGGGCSLYRGVVHRKGAIDFVALMLFTQQVFHLECLLLFRLNLRMVLLMKVLIIKRHLMLLFSLLKMTKYFPI